MGTVHYLLMMHSLWYYFRNLLPTDHQKISCPVILGLMNALHMCKSVSPCLPGVTATNLQIKEIILTFFNQ